MSRPQYETRANRVEEQRVVEKICEKWSLTAHKLPKSYILDHYFCKKGTSDVVLVGEIKVRSVKASTYETFIVAQKKVMAARAGWWEVPCLIFVQWTDVLGWADLKLPDNLTHGGRKDRKDSADIEPMAEFEIKKKFQRLEAVPDYLRLKFGMKGDAKNAQ